MLLLIVIADHVADFAAALTNPIAYQSQLEKHAQQLAVLEDNAVSIFA